MIQAVKDGSKLIITGDNMQLPIGYGDVLHRFTNTEEFLSMSFQVHRQAAKSGILSLASMSGKESKSCLAPSGKEVYELQDQTAISYESKERILPDILHIARSINQELNATGFTGFSQLFLTVKEAL